MLCLVALQWFTKGWGRGASSWILPSPAMGWVLQPSWDAVQGLHEWKL